jgi:hypothetical protein
MSASFTVFGGQGTPDLRERDGPQGLSDDRPRHRDEDDRDCGCLHQPHGPSCPGPVALTPATTTGGNLLSFWAYQTESREFSFFATPTDPEPERGTPVTVWVMPQDFRGPDWRIAVLRRLPDG